MQLTGHKTRSVFERYNIVSTSGLRDAAQRLDATVPLRTLPPEHMKPEPTVPTIAP